MVITTSVMHPFTCHNLLLHSKGIITVLYDLQMFSCPMNSGMTRVHCLAASETRTSSASMTFGMILRCVKTSSTEMTFDAIPVASRDPRPTQFSPSSTRFGAPPYR
jgi:hypothetical protein